MVMMQMMAGLYIMILIIMVLMVLSSIIVLRQGLMPGRFQVISLI